VAPGDVFSTWLWIARVVASILRAETAMVELSTVLKTNVVAALVFTRLVQFNSAVATIVEVWSRKDTKSLRNEVCDALSRPA
jgi:hypothetical protein